MASISILSTMARSRKRLAQVGLLFLLLQYHSHAWLPSLPHSVQRSHRDALQRRNLPLLHAQSIGDTSSATVPSSLSQSPPRNWTSDDQVIAAVLKDRQIQLPWKKGKPVYSTRTFNWLLSQLLLTVHPRDGSSTTLTAESNRKLAVHILRYLLQESLKRPQLQPDTITLNTVLAAHKVAAAAQQAHALLVEWQQLYETTDKVQHAADVISYNTVAAAYAKQGDADGARHILRELQQHAATAVVNDSSNSNCKSATIVAVDAVTYSTVLRAHAVAGMADEAERLWREMVQTAHPAPTADCTNQVLYAKAKSTKKSSATKISTSVAASALQFLESWIHESGRAAANDDDDDDHSRLDPPNTRSYNIVLHALTRSRQEQEALDLFTNMPVRKDTITYTTVIQAVCRSANTKTALEQCDQVLQQAWEDQAVTVDAAMIANVLYSVAECDDWGNVAAFAEQVVEDFMARTKEETDLGIYNALLFCWAKSGDRGAYRRVLDILTALQEHPFLQPNVKTYTTVLNALGRSRNTEAVQAGEDILTYMEEHGPNPNVQVYTALIQNYARSRVPYKAVKASETLQRMKEAATTPDTFPNIVTYNAILNACEHTDRSDQMCIEEALKVAFLTFGEIRGSKQVHANHVSYASFLGAVANLMPCTARQEIVTLVFRQCITTGQVSRLVLKKLRQAVNTQGAYRTLLRGHNEDKLPKEWTARVREARARDL